MSIRKTFFLTSALALGVAALQGCAADRPSRNGVFNENTYLRKAFIIRSGDVDKAGEAAKDPGWFYLATIMQTSTPNPLGFAYLTTGMNNQGMLVRFVATQGHLQAVQQLELTENADVAAQKTRTPEVIASWPATHVDVKYRVNLDGEKTNFLEENQEMDWKARQYMKVQLANPDTHVFSSHGAFSTYIVDRCTDMAHASTTLVPSSFRVAENQDYFEWMTETNLPLKFDDEACVQAFGGDGQMFQKLGRQYVSISLKHSFKRAVPTDKITYKELELDEKDPIRRKYGAFTYTRWTRDPNTQMMAARALAIRFDPEKPLTYYFSQGFPERYKKEWTRPNGIVEQTNRVFEQSGAKIRISVKDHNQDLAQEANGNWDPNDIAACEQARKVGPNPTAADKAAIDACRGRQYGDARFNFLRWIGDLDSGSPFAGVAQFSPDPRTGEQLTANIQFAVGNIRERYAQRLDGYLKSVGCRAAKAGSTDCQDLLSPEPWGAPVEEYTVDDPQYGKVTKVRQLPDACKDGDVAPILPISVMAKKKNASTLYAKMQDYMQKPASRFGNLGPEDFIAKQDKDFFDAYYKVAPYYVFRDPATNEFVTPEGGAGVYGPGQAKKMMDSYQDQANFHKAAAFIDKGNIPYEVASGPAFVQNATKFLNEMRNLQLANREAHITQMYSQRPYVAADLADDILSIPQLAQKFGRRCVGGKWETKEEWVDALMDAYWAEVQVHELGHVLGLEHNFMASVDRPNFPRYKDKSGKEQIGFYSSSVMEYTNAFARQFTQNETGTPGWAPYDRGALAWIYANNTLPQATKDEVKKRKADISKGTSNVELGVSGQFDANFPWKDPAGFEAGKEKQFLFCTHEHMKYSPLCRQNDFGSTPSEIIAAELDVYEWEYQWRNFRQYRKMWDDSAYADGPASRIMEMRRFLSMWGFDFTGAILTDDFRRLGVIPPPGTPIGTYYGQLAEKFDKEMSAAGQMVAAFHKAVIQQSSGERPFRTIYDKYYGDVTQQGIILDKLFAMEGFVGMWPATNYDPGKAGSYIASYTTVGDAEYSAVAEDAVSSMIGEQYYDAFPYFKPLATALFAQDTHSPSFSGRLQVRDWIGGHVFWREIDALQYFRSMAVKYNKLGCTQLETCTYNPMLRRAYAVDTHLSDDYHEFIGPDGRRWAWVYIQDRNAWVFVDRDRNTATYKIVNDYNIQVIRSEAEGNNAYGYQLPVKYFLDSFNYYN
jgi:hypothetical protein